MASNPTHANSIVFVGGVFPPSMFDERELFGGNLDPDQLRAGPISQYSYSSGTFQFYITPERIDLKCKSIDVLPDDIVKEARTIIKEIEPARRVVKVTGIGMNCDTVFDHRDIGMTGIKFCNRFVHATRLHKLIGKSRIAASERVSFQWGALQINVRTEPHANSNGENLLVAINGHQTITSAGPMELNHNDVVTFRSYVGSIHKRIVEVKKEVSK